MKNTNHERKRKKLSKSQRLQKQVVVRVPTNYPWRVWDAVVEDLSQYLDRDDYLLCKQIRKDQDLAAYEILSEDWSLQSNNFSDIRLPSRRARYLLGNLLKKYLFDNSEDTRRRNAIDKFILADEQCRVFNNVGFKALIYGESSLALSVMTYAPEFIRQVIGSELPNQVELTEWSRHGPGSNLGTRRGQNARFNKFANWPYACTERARPHALRLILNDERWLESLKTSYIRRNKLDNLKFDIISFKRDIFKIVESNRIDFVPKTVKTDRSIAIEPDLNLMLQLGVDGFIRRKLLRWGINLDDQSKNQELARLGSINGRYATIDLAAASDTISLRICKLLLPPAWYRYLCDLRSPYGALDGDICLFHKMSSMGNGFTFALESLIFAAIVYAVYRHHEVAWAHDNVAIFGDDLIVKTECAQSAIQALNLCGFTINKEKSFLEGPTRESCGSDWFQGYQLRPVFLTRQPTVVNELYSDLNRIKRKLELFWCNDGIHVHSVITKWIPKGLAIFGPLSDTEYDTYIHTKHRPIKGYYHSCWHFKRLNWSCIPQYRKFVTKYLFPNNLKREMAPSDLWLFGRLAASHRSSESPTWSEVDQHYKENVLNRVLRDPAKYIPKWSDRHLRLIKKAEARNTYTIVRRNAYVASMSKPTAVDIWQDTYIDHGPDGPGAQIIRRTS